MVIFKKPNKVVVPYVVQQSIGMNLCEPETTKSASQPMKKQALCFQQKQVVIVSTLHMIIFKAFEWGFPLEWQRFGL